MQQTVYYITDHNTTLPSVCLQGGPGMFELIDPTGTCSGWNVTTEVRFKGPNGCRQQDRFVQRRRTGCAWGVNMHWCAIVMSLTGATKGEVAGYAQGCVRSDVVCRDERVGSIDGAVSDEAQR
jgi:hypothetical protein